MQLINTAAFGEQAIDPDTLIHFPEGIVGFEDCTRFKLFHEEGGEGLVHWLQSADRPELSLSVADPRASGSATPSNWTTGRPPCWRWTAPKMPWY